MKINEYNGMMKWLTRPKAEATIKKAVNPEGKPMPILDYIKKMNSLYSNYDESEDQHLYTPAEIEDIKKAIPVSELVKKEERFNDKILKRDKYAPKKKIIKVVKKELPKDWQPKYINGNVIDITPIIDDEWWKILDIEPPKEESRLLLVPESKAEGITSILNLHKKRA